MFFKKKNCLFFLGKNMATAKEIEGITDLYFDKERSMFVIKGKSMEACNEARALLEYAEKEVLVTRKMTGKLIGKLIKRKKN